MVFNTEMSVLCSFKSRSVQEVFSQALLSLVHTHLSLVVPLGSQCVHMACGAQVRPLRNFLFKLMDSHLSPDLDLVGGASHTPKINEPRAYVVMWGGCSLIYTESSHFGFGCRCVNICDYIMVM